MFKIVVFGDPNEKKKHFMEQIHINLFESDSKMTIGVDFGLKNVEVNKQKVKLQIWDLPGVEGFRSLLPLYVRAARGGLFMYDITNFSSIAHIDDWLTVIKKETRKEEVFPIICVGLTSGDDDIREVPASEGIKIAKSRSLDGFVECDLESGENVEETFKALVRLMSKKIEEQEQQKEQERQKKLERKRILQQKEYNAFPDLQNLIQNYVYHQVKSFQQDIKSKTTPSISELELLMEQLLDNEEKFIESLS